MAHLGEVRDHFGAISAADGRVIAVSFATPEQTEAYWRQHGLPFAIASDHPRALYHAYGLGRASLATTWRPSAFVQHIQLRMRGFQPGTHYQADKAQLGGDFVIGRDGRVRLAHPSVAGDDRESVDALVRAVVLG